MLSVKLKPFITKLWFVDEKRRVTSAATTAVRPLGELRKTTNKGKGRTRSAVAAVDLRNLVDQQDSMQVEKQIQDDKVNEGERTSLDTGKYKEYNLRTFIKYHFVWVSLCS